MPLPLLIALFLAFGFDVSAGGRAGPGLTPLSHAEAWSRTGQAACGLLALAAFATVLGRLAARRIRRRGRASSTVRKAYRLSVRAVDVLSLIVFGWIVHEI